MRKFAALILAVPAVALIVSCASFHSTLPETEETAVDGKGHLPSRRRQRRYRALSGPTFSLSAPGLLRRRRFPDCVHPPRQTVNVNERARGRESRDYAQCIAGGSVLGVIAAILTSTPRPASATRTPYRLRAYRSAVAAPPRVQDEGGASGG
jgi:hypothetical protein